MKRPNNLEELELWCRESTNNLLSPQLVIKYIEYIKYLENEVKKLEDSYCPYCWASLNQPILLHKWNDEGE